MDETKKKENKSGQIIFTLGFGSIGGVCGWMLAKMIKGKSFGEICFLAVACILFMYAGMFLQIVLHEAGHMVFGLLTGYRFSSFRIGSYMLLKMDGKWKIRRLSIAGTGGQCLMAPPEWKDGKIPYVLYNLGGSIINLAVGGLSIYFAWLCRDITLLAFFWKMMAIIGVGFALMNGLPIHMGVVDNDGCNARSLGKTPEALHAFWVQLKAQEQIAAGVRISEMPEEWFHVSSEEALKNSMIAVLGVFECNRLMEQMKFDEADRLMEHYLSLETGIVGLHRNLLVNDQVYCELVGANHTERLQKLLDDRQQKIMKTMKKYPSVLRTEYAYALLAEKDEKKGQEIKARFEKMAEHYPYPVDIEAERKLMDYAKDMLVL